MARKPRLEIEGGLYHLITRGVDRRDIFRSSEDHQKFLALLAVQKGKLPDHLYETRSGVLGTEEFVDSMIHRMGESVPKRAAKVSITEFDGEALIAAVESAFGVGRSDFCGKAKGVRVVTAKEALIVSGRRLGARATSLAKLTGLDVANVSRRHAAAVRRLADDPIFSATISRVLERYESVDTTESSISQA